MNSFFEITPSDYSQRESRDLARKGSEKYLISMDTEHRGDGKELFDIAFVCFRNGEPFEQFQFVRRDIVEYFLNISGGENGFWSWSSNRPQLKYLKGLCDMEVVEPNIRLTVSLTESDYAWQIRRVVDYLHSTYPGAVWVSDTAGMDLSAINFLLMTQNLRPCHFNKAGDYRGFMFAVDKSVGRNPDRSHSSVRDALWIGCQAKV